MTHTSSVAASDAVNELAAALAAAQGEFPIIEKNRTGHLPDAVPSRGNGSRAYKYADLANVLKGVLPVLSKNKLAVLQPTFVEGGHIFVRTRLMHSSGQWVECEYPVCAVHVDHQRMGSALTYAKRYALCALLGVAADEDNDGAGTTNERERDIAARGSKSARGEHLVRSRPLVRPRVGQNALPPIVSKPPLAIPPQRKGATSKGVTTATVSLNAVAPHAAKGD